MALTTAEFIDRGRARHGDRFDYSRSRYVAYTKPIEVVCREHGSCETTPKSHLHTLTGGCTACLRIAIGDAGSLGTSEFIQRARKVHADRYDYSQVNYTRTGNKVTIVCPLHGTFRMTPARHLQGQGCRSCAFEGIRQQRRMPFWDFIEKTIEVHGVRRYEYALRDHVNSESKIPILCTSHGVFRQTIGNHLSGHGCPRCSYSNGERRLRESLLSLGVEFCEQARFPECRDKKPLPFDFFVPSHRLLIEFDGRQHFESSDLWGGEEKLAETQKHDQIKNQFADSRGYCLLRIPYWEIDNTEDLVLEHLAFTEKTAA